jgi:phosphatidate cytidylyltransferase
MGRHSTSDDDEDDAAALLEYERALATGEIDLSGVTETGRHSFPDLADVPLGPDPLEAHAAAGDVTTTTLHLVADSVVEDTPDRTAEPDLDDASVPVLVLDPPGITLAPPPSEAETWADPTSSATPPVAAPDVQPEPEVQPQPEVQPGPEVQPEVQAQPEVQPEAQVQPEVVLDDGATALAEAEAAAPPVVPAFAGSPQTEEAPPDAPKASRAGRDLPAAIGVGVGLGALVLLTLFLYKPSFTVVVLLAVVYGCYELRTAIATVEARPPLVPLVLGGAAIAYTAYRSGTNGLAVATLLTATAIVIWRLGDGAVGYLRDVASAGFILVYLPVLASFAVLLSVPSDGAARVITFVVLVVCSDTGGYAVGVLFGKHPLAPGVSKGKTWEGSAGSLVACGVAGVLFMTLTFHEAWWEGLLLGAAVMVAATLGDLGESMIKRDLGVKDMGRLLPGHGGLMDRLDSLLPCAAVVYLLLALFT